MALAIGMAVLSWKWLTKSDDTDARSTECCHRAPMRSLLDVGARTSPPRARSARRSSTSRGTRRSTRGSRSSEQGVATPTRARRRTRCRDPHAGSPRPAVAEQITNDGATDDHSGAAAERLQQTTRDEHRDRGQSSSRRAPASMLASSTLMRKGDREQLACRRQRAGTIAPRSTSATPATTPRTIGRR